MLIKSNFESCKFTENSNLNKKEWKIINKKNFETI